MKPAKQWRDELRNRPKPGHVKLITGRDGLPTIKCGSLYLHSRYQPREEAARLINSAQLDPARPVAVIGAGLGYHVQELLNRGFDVAVLEPDPAVAALALEQLLKESDVLFGIGAPDAVSAEPAFTAYMERIPQILVHPPTERLHAAYVGEMRRLIVRAALGRQRLRVAVVGPMYGGSLPIARYIERAFRSLGHVATLVDNSAAWDLYTRITAGVKNRRAGGQLTEMFARFLNEWSYARTAEFLPDICLVMAQAPVDGTFPARLRNEGVVTAFWYVENWRHFPYWKTIAPIYDCFFHIQPGPFEEELAKAGCPFAAFLPTACDPEIHRPVALAPDEEGPFSCDVSFAGAAYPNRIATFKGLTDFDFKIWGVDWHANELQPFVQHPDERFTAEDFAKIVAGSKINLNLHASVTAETVDPNADAVNPRVFEIAACGGFQLSDPCMHLDTLFSPETEIPVYRDLTDLRTRIDYFLQHPDERRAYAERARARALREHTYAHRAGKIIELLLDQYGTRLLRKGIRIQRSCAETARLVGRDTPLGRYLSSLPPDLLFTHENINAQLPPPGPGVSHPEQLFIYLREIRNFAENLLEAR